MSLTNIGQQKTPGRPVEVTFAADTGLPSDAQIVLLIGHAASGATGTNTVIAINNVADAEAAQTEAETKFGVGSELAKMVVAAVKANEGGSTFPALKAVPLDIDEVSIPTAAQNAIKKTRAEYVVTPYDLHTDTAQRTILKAVAIAMSGAQNVENNQFGTFGVGANRDQTDPSLLFMFDTQALIGLWMRDTGTDDLAPVYSLGEVAAAGAARMAANGVPYNPQDSVTIQNLACPLQESDWPTVGAGLESESCLQRGWTPLFTKPNQEVAFVRTVTGRISADGTGSPVVTAYYDVQDFRVLYFWRQTLFTRFSQPDFKERKAAKRTATAIKAEAIRLAQQFEDQEMFQAVQQLAKRFQVVRNASDRHRFDVKTPVNVIPGLHVIATNVEATTEFDVITV